MIFFGYNIKTRMVIRGVVQDLEELRKWLENNPHCLITHLGNADRSHDGT